MDILEKKNNNKYKKICHIKGVRSNNIRRREEDTKGKKIYNFIKGEKSII